MLLDIYVLLAVVSFILMILGIVKKDLPIFAWIAAFMMVSIALMSAKVETEFCQYISGAWSCYNTNYSDPALIWFWGAIGLFMMIYSILATFVWGAKSIEGA